MNRPSLGLIMIVKNERENLERSLAPVASRFDQVVVVDTGSSDRSGEYCRQLGASVHHFPWVDDFSSARNHSIETSSSDWLFWLDADNAISPGGVDRLRDSLPDQGPAIVWALEKVVPSGERLWQKRLFPRRDDVRFVGRIHEQLSHPAHWPELMVEVEISHWGYEDPAKVREKGEYYLSLLNQSLKENPGDFYAHFQAAKCLINLRQMAKAESHLRELIADSEALAKNPELWLQGNFTLSRLMETGGRHQEASDLSDRLLLSHGRHALVQFHAGRLAYADSRWNRTVDYLELALSLGLQRPVVDTNMDQVIFSACYMLGHALEKLGHAKRALDAFRRSAGIMPKNTAPLSRMARIHMALGDLGMAASVARRALAVRPEDRSAAHILARCKEKAA